MKPYTTPDQALSPEEDAQLQIIEATEVMSINEPPVQPPLVKLAPLEHKVVGPVSPSVIKPVIKALPIISSKKPVIMPTVNPPELLTPAAQIANELAHAPKLNFAKFALLFFPKHKFSRKPLLLFVCVLLVVGGVVIGLVSWQTMHSISR